MLRAAVAAALAVGPLTGCVLDEWAAGKTINGITSRVVETPKLDEDALAVAERVNDVGRRVIEQNTFTGLDPLFTVIGDKGPVLTHRGVGQLFVSDALVVKCKTDDELAAVLCHELGLMLGELRSARSAGVALQPLPEKVLEGDAPTPPPTAPDGPVGETDPVKLAAELRHGAGVPDAAVEKVAPLLKAATEHTGPFQKQLVGSAPAPKWNR